MLRYPGKDGTMSNASTDRSVDADVIAFARFVTFEDDSAVERVFGAGRMHTIGGKSVEVKPATPRGSGPTGLAMGRGFAMVLPGRGMTRGGFAEMAPATAAAYPGGPYQGYAGMVPYATGGRLQPMVRIPLSSSVPARVLQCFVLPGIAASGSFFALERRRVVLLGCKAPFPHDTFVVRFISISARSRY